MKKIISFVLTLTTIISAFAINYASTTILAENYKNETFLERVKNDYKLVFADEFDGDTLDDTKWNRDVDCRRNSELQYYTGDEGTNLQFDGENAVIVPKVENAIALKDGKKFKYTSAEISTQGKYAWKYGYLEVRAKQSCGKNVVPAIWMLGYDYSTGGADWPYSGEIDITERLSNDKSIESTLHHGNAYGQKWHASTGIGNQSFNHNINEQFHNYWLFWTDKYLVVGVDDNMHTIVDITQPHLSQSFRTYAHWLIINVALGMFSAPVDNSEAERWKMFIDYVRVYQLDNDADYDKYLSFSAHKLKHNSYEEGNVRYTQAPKPISGTNNLTFTIDDELKPGKYDIYAEASNTKNGLETYINNEKANETIYVNHGVNIGHQIFVGSVDLQDDSNFDITFKDKGNENFAVEKLMFIKTDETKNTPVVVNKDSGAKLSDYFEVSNASELENAAKYLRDNGTIKFLDDITISKSIYALKNCNIDLNGKTLTINKGTITLAHDQKTTTIKNGNIKIANGASGAFSAYAGVYKAKIRVQNVNIDVDTSSEGFIFNNYYSSLDIQCDSCNFTFSDKAKSIKVSKNNAVYNNCTFDFNGSDAFLVNKDITLQLNSCIVNNANILFYSDKALETGNIKLANTNISNLGKLTNYEENASFITVDFDSVLKQNGEEVEIFADMSGDFTMECNHSFVDADCTKPKHCEYCNKSEGVALGHNLTTQTTESDCVYVGSIKTYCQNCSYVHTEKKLPIAEHNYKFDKTIESSCLIHGYHLWICTDCGSKKQLSFLENGQVTPQPKHSYDESKTIVVDPTCTTPGYSKCFCVTCNRTYTGRYKDPLEHDYEKTYSQQDKVFVYKCKTCGSKYTEECNHEVIEDSKVVIAPTLTSEGYTEHTCKHCNEKIKSNIVPALYEGITINMKTYDSASIRINEKTGLRFYTEIDKEAVASLREQGYTVQLGTLIAPHDIIFDKNLTFDLDEGYFIDVKYQSNEYYTDGTGFSGIVGSIANIKETTVANPEGGNITRKFIARGYAKVIDDKGNTVIYFADFDKHKGRSLGYVSLMLRNDTEEFLKDIYQPFKNKINFWADRYVIESDPKGNDKW